MKKHMGSDISKDRNAGKAKEKGKTDGPMNPAKPGNKIEKNPVTTSNNTSSKEDSVFPFVSGETERAVLAWSALAQNPPAPMLVRTLIFLRSEFQGRWVHTAKCTGLFSPTAVCELTNGMMLVACAGKGAIHEFSKAGGYSKTVGLGAGSELGMFSTCGGVAEFADGFVASDTMNSRLQFYSAGKFTRAIPIDSNDRVPARPQYITVLPSGVIAISDLANSVVYLVNPVLDYYKCDSSNSISFKSTSSYPVGLAATAQGELAVVNGKHKSIEVYDMNARTRVREFGKSGTELKLPTDITIDHGGNFVVCDNGNFALQVFHPDGELVKTVPLYTEGQGQIKSMQGIALLKASGGMVISDQSTNALHYFF